MGNDLSPEPGRSLRKTQGGQEPKFCQLRLFLKLANGKGFSEEFSMFCKTDVKRGRQVKSKNCRLAQYSLNSPCIACGILKKKEFCFENVILKSFCKLFVELTPIWLSG